MAAPKKQTTRRAAPRKATAAASAEPTQLAIFLAMTLTGLSVVFALVAYVSYEL